VGGDGFLDEIQTLREKNLMLREENLDMRDKMLRKHEQEPQRTRQSSPPPPSTTAAPVVPVASGMQRMVSTGTLPGLQRIVSSGGAAPQCSPQIAHRMLPPRALVQTVQASGHSWIVHR